MHIEFLYWEQTLAYPAGHAALRMTQQGRDPLFADMRTSIYLVHDNGKEMPAFFLSESLTYFESGLKLLAVEHRRSIEDFSSQRFRVPSDTVIYEALYDCFDSNVFTKHHDFDDWAVFFENKLKDYRCQLGKAWEATISNAVSLAEWLERELTSQQLSLDRIKARGMPDGVQCLDFLNGSNMITAFRELQARQKSIVWFAKSGYASVKLDDEVIRFNCASYIGYLLKRGGLCHLSAGFDEKVTLVAALQKSVKLESEANGLEADQAALGRIGQLSCVSRMCCLFACRGRHAITQHYGSVPAVLNHLVTYAISKRAVRTHQPTYLTF